ncbi:MAG: toll/interleukin-1 receptor domain-containing protein [Candidatus Aminicenantes bacterium]|nr:toll/interleukin-1 receptor domain-containing protein [Candidatus Aminicenantes bacterium]
MSKVFISYSHKDRPWKERLAKHLKVLETEGYYTYWDDGKIKAGGDWFREIKTALNEAQIAVLLISADFLTSRFILEKEVPILMERRQKEGVRVIPLILHPCPWQAVQWLSAMQLFPKDGIPLSTLEEPEIDTQLANLALVCRDVARNVSTTTTTTITTTTPQPPPPPIYLSGDHITLSRLPVTDKAVFGRETEAALLDEAWQDDHCNVVTLIAWGGVGKTALVNHWLNGMAKDHFRSAEKVYGWSFYSQGAAEGKQASADEFIQETLRWFGDPDPKAGAPEEKGRRLAGLIRKSRTLLVLDGMEPLQHPPGKDQAMTGRLKDPGLRVLLRELAVSQPGLCVVTSREKVADLSVYEEPAVKTKELEHLSLDAGTALLKHLGAQGREQEITQAVDEYGGHALALTLLGKYLCMGYDGDIRKRDTIGALIGEPGTGGHAKRMMQAYCHWLGESAECNILYLMGLFDRPVEAGAIEVLKTAPAIPGLTDRLVELAPVKWNYAVNRLRELGLLAKSDTKDARKAKAGGLDCHPLVREYFGERLKQENPEAWKEAHTRLYEYYRKLPKKECPDTLEEMAPLFSAVAHSCLAGRHQETMDEVFNTRIIRGTEVYIVHKLGAFGATLSALSHFFAVPWDQPASGLSEPFKAAVLNWSAFGLRALGRLREAVQPMKVSLEMLVKQENWKSAAAAASNLSELLLTLGDVREAVAAARESVSHADRSGDASQRESKRTSLADALHQAGADQWQEAEELFREAEEMQKKRQPGFHFLYSQGGYRYCDLLLEQGKDQEVMERAETTLAWVTHEGWLLDISLDCLTLGRAWLERTRKDHLGDPHAEPWTRAREFLDRAVTGLREAGYQHMLVLGLLARAAYFRWQGDFDAARTDLCEAREIAESGDMKLFICDYHLEAARLCEAEGKTTDAAEHSRAADALIEETGYYRRKTGPQITRINTD